MRRTIIGYHLQMFKITYITNFPSPIYQYFAKYALCYVCRNIIRIFPDTESLHTIATLFVDKKNIKESEGKSILPSLKYSCCAIKS